jgi:methyl-galactoside transport system substrate-binding protein
MKKKLIPVLALGMLGMLLTACNGTADYTRGTDINYVLLIGQIDHNDSAARTRGIREALGTRPTTHLTNPNNEDPVTGSLTIGSKAYTINEIEHAEQKNSSGATWDQTTAHDTAQTWISKHATDKWKETDGTIDQAQGITFFVSNNDGMAVGAIGASNWVSGMPIFGYDSNSDALQDIKDGVIMGTINQNASDQAAGIFMVARNAMDGLTGSAVYTQGISAASDNGYGKVTSSFTYNATNKSLLVNNFAITASNVDSYLGKTASDLIDTGVTKGTTAAKNVFLSVYSSSDTFLHSNVLPLMELYQDKFNLSYTKYEGDGNDESKILDQLAAADAKDAYLINMTKTTSTLSYLDAIATKVGASTTTPSSVPVIFWNRQGTTSDGSVDTTNMTDARFTTILYVGFDANQGGDLQGSMIVDYLTSNIATLAAK